MSEYRVRRYEALTVEVIPWYRSLGLKLLLSGIVLGALTTAALWYGGV